MIPAMNLNLPYAVEVVIANCLLWGLYVLLFDRRIPHSCSRAYLVAVLLFSAAVPALEIPLLPAEPLIADSAVAELDMIGITVRAIVEYAPAWRVVAMSVWLAGTAVMLMSILLQIIRLRRLRRNGAIERCDGCSILRTREPIAPFSFWRTIYIPESLAEGEVSAVISHETSHITHGHTVERIAAEIIKAVMWWNPFAWLTVRKLTEAEEYEADSDVIRGGCDKRSYMELILRRQIGFNPRIANSLHRSTTKKRFVMMTRSMGRYARLRLLATLPVAAFLLAAFAFTARAAGPAKPLAKIAPDEVVAMPEQMPEFQGGNVSDFRRWMMTNLKYPEKAMKKGIAGRVVVRFIVEADGEVSGVEIMESSHKLLSDEVLRVFGRSPRWTPGKQGGKEVRTSFMLPLDFKL